MSRRVLLACRGEGAAARGMVELELAGWHAWTRGGNHLVMMVIEGGRLLLGRVFTGRVLAIVLLNDLLLKVVFRVYATAFNST